MLNIDNAALENDVREILFQNSEVRLNQIRNIVLDLPDYKRKINIEGAARSSLSRTLDTYISRILSRLRKDGEVSRHFDEKKEKFLFSYTKLGRKKAPHKIMYTKLRDSTKIPPQELLLLNLPQILDLSLAASKNIDKTGTADAKTIMTLHDVAPLGKASVDVALWLDQANKDKIQVFSQKLVKELFLENTAERFVETCKSAIVEATKNAYRWNGWKNGPPQLGKMVETVKNSLDFEAILMLHFDGKRLVNTYDWKKDVDQYEKHDENERKRSGRFSILVDEPGITREAWKNYSILDCLYWINYSLEVLNNGSHVISKETSSLVTGISEHIVNLMTAGKELHEDPEPPSVEEAQKIIEGLLEDGTLEFAYTLRLNNERANVKKRQNAIIVNNQTGYWLDPAVEFAEELKNEIANQQTVKSANSKKSD